MAIVQIDPMIGDGANRYNVFTSITHDAATTPPDYAYSYRLDANGDEIVVGLGDPATNVCVGFWYRHQSPNNNGNRFKLNHDGAVDEIALTFDSGGVLTVELNDSDIAASAGGVIGDNVWHWIEARFFNDNAAGRVEVWVDGIKVIDYTGDTRNSASVWNWIQWNGFNGTSWYLAPIYTTTGETAPRGLVRAVQLKPSGNGFSSGLTGSDADSVDNYLHVDEAVSDGDTSYVEGATEGLKDTYALENMPAGGWEILAVQSSITGRTTEAGPKYVRPVFRIGGTDYAGASSPLITGYKQRREIFETSPATASAWTKTEVDGMEFGPEVRDS